MEKIKEIFKKENSFFSLVEGAKRRTHVVLAIAAMIVIFVLSAVITHFSTILIFGEDNQLFIRKFYTSITLFALMIFFIWLFVKYFENRSFRTIGFFKQGALTQYLKGFLLGIVLLAVSFIVIAIFSEVKIVTVHNQPNYFYTILTVLMALIFFIVQGAGEEIVFRGWFMQTVGYRHWPWLGVLLSIVLFSLAHFSNAGMNILPFLNVALIAVFLSLYILKEKSLWGVCGFHTSWNWTMGNVLGLSVSGNEGIGDSIVNFSFKGNDIITGGSFGLEASIIVTIIFVGVIIWNIRSFNTSNS
ncbi:MAG: CPBP family intramembrane glutamic endopeptidase [Tenuifilaceae bacterium]